MDDITPPLLLLDRFRRYQQEGLDLHSIAMAREGWEGVADAISDGAVETALEFAQKAAEREQEFADPEWRRGGYILTVTGTKFYPLDPRPEDVEPYAIAHALAGKGRFGCHSSRFYSVGAHVLRVRLLAEELARREGLDPRTAGAYALVHDHHEAYLPDVPAPVKPFLPGWYELEELVQGAINQRLGLGVIPAEVAAVVKMADSYALGLESRVLYDATRMDVPGLYPPDERLVTIGQVVRDPWMTKEEVRDGLMEAMRQLCPRFELEEDTTEEPAPSGTSSWRDEAAKTQTKAQEATDARTAKWRALLGDK